MGMSCSHCEQTVERGLAGTAGIVKVKADSKVGSVILYYKGEAPDLGTVNKKIIALGYEPVENG